MSTNLISAAHVIFCKAKGLRWLQMTTSPSPPSAHADKSLQGLLPPDLWKLLARHDITTLAQVEALYPAKLLKIHYLGPVRFRQIEALLFPGRRYEVPVLAPIETEDLDGTSLEGLVSRRVLITLRRHGIKTVQQLVAAYPRRLVEITGFGIKALREVEATFFDGQRFEPMKSRKTISNTIKQR
ncbi:DNA-directed RNA polymerase subunit alpha C-terminal domain-containing protein [Comamonas sp. MYb396]|uniref:DNA-directed RNA polymerase subunit alpha C-terminal domain-containing protein n=1 Tax=Comamonas sp. MYb396 TaxID=2745302 RepID=UPI0028AB2631|nr:DNA-directed RNA polymerase subunit alpha C-terminal domain-containing protein [Comamonas koreensis]